MDASDAVNATFAEPVAEISPVHVWSYATDNDSLFAVSVRSRTEIASVAGLRSVYESFLATGGLPLKHDARLECPRPGDQVAAMAAVTAGAG